MAASNTNSRLEAFCDGVFAIALTLLILDIKLPSAAIIDSTSAFWLALGHTAPSVFAFLLSFTVILITWVNHHGAFKLVDKSSPAFMYANGFLLLTVVFIPFPTALLGGHLLTDHAAPAVVLYDSVIALQAIGWILVCSAALRDRLTRDEQSARVIRGNRTAGYFACVLYGLCALAALWFPLFIAIVTAALWVFWLIYGIRVKDRGEADLQVRLGRERD